MKYVDFADKVDEHFAMIQKLVNELSLKPEHKDKFGVHDDCLKRVKEQLIVSCISLNHRINDECAQFLESE